MTRDGYYHRGSPRGYQTDGERVHRNQLSHQRINSNFSNNNYGSNQADSLHHLQHQQQQKPQQQQHQQQRHQLSHQDHLQSDHFQNREQQQYKRQPSDPTERCECCPFGYHIDLDFMRICDEISSGVNLREIKKPSKSRSRRKYPSVSKEVVSPPVPPRSSSMPIERKGKPLVGKEKGESAKVDDIFSRENQEFWDIYHQFDDHLKQTYSKKSSSKSRRNRMPSDTQSLPPDPLDTQLSDAESISSEVVFSSTTQLPTSSRMAMGTPRGNQGSYFRDHHRYEPLRVNLHDMADLSDSNTSISSTCSSSRFSPLPFGGAYSSLPNVHTDSSTTASGRSTPSSLSANTLTMIRQQMAGALVRMKQLEDQVKSIPTMQVKINVLREEKRLLKMQIKKKEEMEQEAEKQRQAKEDELLKREAELKRKEIDLQKRETDLEEQIESQKEMTDPVFGASSNPLSANQNNQRPSTLEELAEKLNKLKKIPPPVAPKPNRGALRKAVVPPYVHTRTVGVYVDTVKQEVRDVGVSVNIDTKPKQLSFQPINVTMWKPSSLLGVPVSKMTQTDSVSVSDVSVGSSVTPVYEIGLQAGPCSQLLTSEVGTQTVIVDEKAATLSVESSTQTSREQVPFSQSRESETQTEEIKVRAYDALCQTESPPEKIMDTKGTLTCIQVMERSTSTEKLSEKEVYSRGTLTDVIQRRHMAINTETVEEEEIIPLAVEEVSTSPFMEGMMEVDTKDEWTLTEQIVSLDAFTETEVTIRRQVGALADVAMCTDKMYTFDRGTSSRVDTQSRSCLATTEQRDVSCGVDVCAMMETSTITDTLEMIDSETCWDDTNMRTFATNTEILTTTDTASEILVATKDQCSQMEDIEVAKECCHVGIQANLTVDVIDMGVGDKDVNFVICDKCASIKQSSASVSVSESDFCRTRTIGTNHSVVTRSIGTGSFTVFEKKLFVEDGNSENMCNACKEKLGMDHQWNRVSVGVGGDTTLDKQSYSAGERFVRSDTSPTNRTFPATNPKERRRPRSHSSPAINTSSFISEHQFSSQPSAKLSFPEPPDFTRFKWSNQDIEANQVDRDESLIGKEGSVSSHHVSEADDTSALEESTESIFRAEDTVHLRRKTEDLTMEPSDADESPLEPIPKNELGCGQYNRQTSQESSSAPHSTSHSLSSLATSSGDESDDSSSSDGSFNFSTTTEGSYDGRTGRVHVKRKRKVSPKKKQKEFVFPQKVPLSPSSFQACQVIDKHVKQKLDSQDKEYLSSLNSILREWFEISSQENSEVEHVQGYLMSLADVSKQVLKKIINMADGNGNTALHYSISHGNFMIVDALLGSGVCDVNKPNKAGATAMMLTSLATIQDENYWKTVEKLFTMGDVNIRASQAGQTALMLAVSRGNVRMVQLLLNYGADVNVQDEDGSTALMCASEHGHLDIVRLLVAQPTCDINVTDNDGSNAFSIAMENGHKAIGVLLYAHMNFGKQSSPKKRVSSASPSGKNTLSSLPQLVSSHSSAFTPVSKSLPHDAPSSQDAATKPPTRSRSLSPTLRQTSLHSLRNSKFQSPARVVYSKSVGSSSPKPTPGSAKATPGSANGTVLNSGKSSVPQSGFQRNTPMRRSGPARVRNVEGNGLVSTLKKSSDTQSKYKSV